MFNANVKIIEELKQFVSIVIQTPEFLELFSATDTAFSRRQKLTFDRFVLLIAKFCKKTLSVEIEKFFEEMDLAMPCSVSAFSQQRMKLKPIFYEIWNEVLTASYYCYYGQEVKRWKGYRLITTDGYNISLVNTPSLQGYFRGQRNQQCSYVQAKTFYFYDILNELLLFAQFQPYRKGELPMAYANINTMESDMLMIYDRHFCNYKMVTLHQCQEKENQVCDTSPSISSSDPIFYRK